MSAGSRPELFTCMARISKKMIERREEYQRFFLELASPRPDAHRVDDASCIIKGNDFALETGELVSSPG
jgi:hypothetical protein